MYCYDWMQTMKLNYYPETDSLYIDLSEKSSVESREISEGVVLDYDAEGILSVPYVEDDEKIFLKTIIPNRGGARS